MKLKELHESEERSVLSVMGKQRKLPAGDFWCDNNNLTSLVGSPPSVGGSFSCDNNNLTSLVGAPSPVGGSFYCDNNKLISLEGAPPSVKDYFSCDNNNLASLVGAPSSVGVSFSCCSNKLTSLDGAPTSVGYRFVCRNNKLTSLKDIHKHIKHIRVEADFINNPIISNVLGLMIISGLSSIRLDNKKVQEIINKHLKGDRDIFACQEELIAAGFEDFAQL